MKKYGERRRWVRCGSGRQKIIRDKPRYLKFSHVSAAVKTQRDSATQQEEVMSKRCREKGVNSRIEILRQITKHLKRTDGERNYLQRRCATNVAETPSITLEAPLLFRLLSLEASFFFFVIFHQKLHHALGSAMEESVPPSTLLTLVGVAMGFVLATQL